MVHQWECLRFPEEGRGVGYGDTLAQCTVDVAQEKRTELRRGYPFLCIATLIHSM
jgi:hypothetical protein